MILKQLEVVTVKDTITYRTTEAIRTEVRDHVLVIHPTKDFKAANYPFTNLVSWQFLDDIEVDG